MSDSRRLTKMSFVLDPAEWHRSPGESFWVEPVLTGTPDKVGFVLQNSPFFVRGVSFLDTVRGKEADDGNLEFDGVIARGGHSTYMLLVPPDSPLFEEFWQRLKRLGCSYEGGGEMDLSIGPRLLYSVDVPEASDIHAVIAVLDGGEHQGVWMYQTGHLGHSLERR